MKSIKYLLSSIALFASANAAMADGPLSIKSLRTSEWSAQSAPVFRSMADGKHYTAIANGGRAIVKYQYSNGQAVDTLLNLDNVKPGGNINDYMTINRYLASDVFCDILYNLCQSKNP